MARFFAGRVVIVAAVLLAGGAVAGVALAAGGNNGSPASASGGSGGAVSSVAVVRTTLATTEQVGGSIGFGDLYTISSPSGASAASVAADQQTVSMDGQSVAQDQQTLSGDEQTLTGDQRAEADTATAGRQAVAADQATVTADQSILAADQAKENYDCTYTSSQANCDADKTQVRTDQTALATAQQALAAERLTAKDNNDQAVAKVGADQAKVGADQAKVTGDQVKASGDGAALSALAGTAVNPGTTYTWLPAVGQVIKQDQPVYTVSGQPVPLLYGGVAAYRPFYPGMSDGADVGELTRDLITLGYGTGLTQSNHYSAATAAAVTRWQRALGLPASGKILLGDVVFEPGPIRVTTVTPTTGAAVTTTSATVLTATGTTPVVTVDLDVTLEYLIKPGDSVQVVLPDGTSTAQGQVETVGTVATCPGSGNGTGTGTATTGQSTCSSSGSGTSSSPTVTVTISLAGTPQGARLDEAPVNVNITSDRAQDVLAVPVNALLALAGGGYGVDVVTGTTTRLVAVTTGLYSSTLVQISGPGISEGTRVEVPSS